MLELLITTFQIAIVLFVGLFLGLIIYLLPRAIEGLLNRLLYGKRGK